MDQLIEIVTYLALLSVAAERFTDIIKRLVLSKYNVNGAVYQLVAAGFGGFVALIDNPRFAGIEVGRYVQVLLIGLAVSGGSGAWNSILSVLQEYSRSLKESVTASKAEKAS